MGGLATIGFATPWLLWGLLALPVLWWLLRAVPPAPLRKRFAAVVLLLGLRDEETTPDRTPWWLLLLRIAAVGLLILGFAGPILNPAERAGGSGPLLVLADGSWSSARDWGRRTERMAGLIEEAGRAGRPVAVVLLTDLPADGPPFRAAQDVSARLAGLAPRPWAPDMEAARGWLDAAPGSFETWWFSDGLDHPGRDALRARLEQRGALTVFESGMPVIGLVDVADREGRLAVTLRRAAAGPETEVDVVAIGPDPSGVERPLARLGLAFGADATETSAELSLPSELRNRLTRFEIAGLRSAGAVRLTDDTLARRKVALVGAASGRGEAQELLSPLFYLRRALAPTTDLIELPLEEALVASPHVVILADVATLAAAEAEALAAWVEAGGTLIRFAGPRLAASEVARDGDDPLMPVRLRAGGRSIGGTLSWGEPRKLRPFEPGTPFHGLEIPADVEVSAQVVAQPGPDLAERSIAMLEDGTPLVTRAALGQGRVVLFHVTANAEWSTLPLSGLFVQMLERLSVTARSTALSGLGEEADASVWTADRLLDGFGALRDAGAQAGVSAARLAEARPGPDAPPGLYTLDDRRAALNVLSAETVLAPSLWPEGTRIEGVESPAERLLAGPVLAAALALLLLDILAALWVGGRLAFARAGRTAACLGAVILAAGMLGAPGMARADDALAIRATSETVLAYVRTGDSRLDALSEAGLRGLSLALTRRTTVEPADPIGVDLETDELAFFPMLYWPISPAQPRPSAEAYGRLNAFLRSGGMIVFDTRDADVGGFGAATPEGRKLRELAAPLDIPPLEPVPADHVLTRTFYLLVDFPGRFTGRDVWLEAAPPEAERAEGMPFRSLNDGVTPVVIGGNDWASAWAVDARGAPLYPVGRGFAGERQREFALRFGINLVMYVLTGNYKSDQVHVPALLDRLGQ